MIAGGCAMTGAPITDRVTSRLTEFGLVTAHELVPRSAQTSLDRHASDRP